MTTDPGDLVLDPTCGSGTTAAVAEQWGRRWITIDTSRVALALARTRLMSARYPYYHLAADHPDLPLTATDEEIKAYLKNPQMHADARRYKEESLHLRSSALTSADRSSSGDIKKGFVYRRVPHITLKSIANNPDIDAIHDKWQPQLDALRAEINRAAGERWEEWEVPRTAGEQGSGGKEQELLARWWELRRERQAEIDAAIGRHADTEILFDQPYEDNKRLRVAGQFTVESLSPHRTIDPRIDPQMDADERRFEDSKKNLRSSASLSADHSSSDFTAMILDNLRKAGVQNTKKGERLKFDRLDAYPGRWLHAAGEYTDSDGRPRRVAVSIGPEHNTVGPQQIKDAAKEAVQGVGFDLLLVCGFAFDPHVNEEATRYGALTVQPVRMNPDLAMGDELLKKTGAGNLFMIFGEPDLKKDVDAGGRLTIELLGLDIYDPTTGEIRSSSTDDIACWFIDTDYDGESFFVRHAYFTGADEPYDKLKRALRAEVDEAAWAELYSTRSRPFDRPESGRIAVKVINHYGDEVLKVYEV
jgi:adenine-specific DNA-methyltransferase